MEVSIVQKDLKPKIIKLLHDINKKFIEREKLSRIMALAIFSRQHIFLIGKPGTGKTAISSIMSSMVEDSTFWEKVVDNDTKKYELFGDVEKSMNERNLKETVIGNDFVLLDEMFKAKSDVLNANLPILNERVYQEHGISHPIPLITMFGASNEMPLGEKIKPFDDRLLFRDEVERIQKPENMTRFLAGDYDKSKEISVKFTKDELLQIHQESLKIKQNNHFVSTYQALIKNILAYGIEVSDRKFGYTIDVLKTSAYLNNRMNIDYSDFFLLNYIAWTKLKDKKDIKEITYDYFFASPNEIEAEFKDIEKNVANVLAEEKFEIGEYLGNATDSFSNETERKFEIISEETVYSFMMTYKLILEKYQEIEKKQIFAATVENKIKNNIFLWDIKGSTFTEEVVTRYKKGIELIQKKMENIAIWKEKNKDYFTYQDNCIKKKKFSNV